MSQTPTPLPLMALDLFLNPGLDWSSPAWISLALPPLQRNPIPQHTDDSITFALISMSLNLFPLQSPGIATSLVDNLKGTERKVIYQEGTSTLL